MNTTQIKALIDISAKLRNALSAYTFFSTPDMARSRPHMVCEAEKVFIMALTDLKVTYENQGHESWARSHLAPARHCWQPRTSRASLKTYERRSGNGCVMRIVSFEPPLSKGWRLVYTSVPILDVTWVDTLVAANAQIDTPNPVTSWLAHK